MARVQENNSKRVVVFAAHPDDEVLGMGGTLARLCSEGHEVHIHFFSDGEGSRSDFRGQYVKNRIKSAAESAKILGYLPSNISFSSFPDNKMDTVALLDVIKDVEAVIDRIKPSTVYTHYKDDLNIDHRVVNDAVMTACRPVPSMSVKKIVEFFVPSSTNWNNSPNFTPNYFVNIEKFIHHKDAALEQYKEELRAFPSIRSVQSIKMLDKLNGSFVGTSECEIFNIVRLIE